ncbi:OmpP1/FadL family transporter [Rhizobium sp. 21-4511-3d]
MASRMFSKGVASLVILSSMASVSYAGGFSRGEADTDILFEDGTFVWRGGVTWVSPHRDFDTVAGAEGTDGRYSNNYAIPSFAAKLKLSDNFACAATYTQPFGGSSTYGNQAYLADIAADGGNGTRSKKFITNEYGLACDVNVDMGKGQLHFIGGGFLQSFKYNQDTLYGNLELKDEAAPGYRLGVAYEIPEYALRAQVMYRSQVDHKADGAFTPGALAPLVGTDDLYSYGSGSLPQSVKVSLQSGVAPGWLVYGSVEWTDWSVLQSLNYNIDLLGPQQLDFFYRDGWTIQAGVAHAFTDTVAGTVNLTWDRGVGTGADIMSDTWTLATGASIKAGPGEFRLGAGISYLTAGSQSLSQGALFNATANGDWAVGLSGSYKISF